MEKDLPLGLRFSFIDRAFKRAMDERLAELDLTGVQFSVLRALERLEHCGAGEVNQKDLEAVSRVTHSTMTEIIKRLEKKGFIECEVSCIDRRHKKISSTEKNKQLRYDVRKLNEDVFGSLCRGLSEQQVEQLMVITDIMLKNICSEKGCNNNCD